MGTDRDIWAAFNDAQAGRSPRPLVTRVLELAGPGEGRNAVDLGCGAGVETRAMAAMGWRVTAVDSDTTMPARLEDVVATGAVTVITSDLRAAHLPPAALVHSSYALPFVPPVDFPPLWQRIKDCLLPGGWLAADFFGERDSWYGTPSLTFHDRRAIDEQLADLEVVDIAEEEDDGHAFGGEPKHWHVFHVIARRPLR